jgi:L-ascorbate metabolism protein UlaG (beta-lactamase superfamily)
MAMSSDVEEVQAESGDRPGTEERRWSRRRFLAMAGGAVVTVPPMSACMAGHMLSAPPYQGPTSPHFDGRTFVNLHHRVERGFSDFLRWRFTREQGPWGPRILQPPAPRPPARVGRGEVRVTFVNHATALVQMDGLNILTDPIWSERCSPISWAGPRRFRAPGIRFEDLPPIDVVVLSHNHYDHMDVPTLRRLQAAHQPKIFTPLGNARFLEGERISGATDLDWWGRAELDDRTEMFAVPAEHWSGRGTRDRGATLWCGYLFRGPSGSVLFAGDTGYGPHFRQIRERYGPSRLALLPIGAYLPRWFMEPVHMSPADAVMAHEDLRATSSVAIHHGTFMLADDAQDQPVEELSYALKQSKFSEHEFWALDHGEGRDVPPA